MDLQICREEYHHHVIPLRWKEQVPPCSLQLSQISSQVPSGSASCPPRPSTAGYALCLVFQ